MVAKVEKSAIIMGFPDTRPGSDSQAMGKCEGQSKPIGHKLISQSIYAKSNRKQILDFVRDFSSKQLDTS